MHIVFVRLSFFVDCLQTQSEYPEISFNFDTLVFIAVLDGDKSSSSTEFKSLTSDFPGNELKGEKVSCQGHFLLFSGAGAITCPELCLHHHLEYQSSTRSSWISREKNLTAHTNLDAWGLKKLVEQHCPVSSPVAKSSKLLRFLQIFSFTWYQKALDMLQK